MYRVEGILEKIWEGRNRSGFDTRSIDLIPLGLSASGRIPRGKGSLGASDRVRWRKVGHVESFAYYLVTDGTLSSTHLLDAGESEFNRFFFWKYIRRFPNSRSDAESFTRDLRDFYKHQACLGRLRDASFAELFYHMRKLIGERIELYDLLLVVARIDRPGGVRGGACVTGSAERPVHLVAWPSSSSTGLHHHSGNDLATFVSAFLVHLS